MHSTFILDLPPESLATILGFYAESLHYRLCATETHDETYDVMELIAITHVCQTFRTIALDCSELWCTITLQKPEVVKHLLDHSGTRPLRVFLSRSVYCYSERLSYMQEALSDHHKRIKELQLCLPREDARTILSKIWKALPLLSSIYLSTGGSSSDIIELDMIPLPSLKMVHLCATSVRFPWSMCRDLTSLLIAQVNVRYLQLSDLLEVLSNSPRLRRLVVYSMILQRTDSAIKRIEFEPGAVFIFDNLTNPDVLALVDIISNVALHKLNFRLTSWISHDESAHLRELVCRLGSHHFWLQLVDARDTIPILELTWEPTSAELHVAKSPMKSWFSGPASPLSFVEHLHLHFHEMSMYYYTEEESLDDIFGGFPSVVDLSISGCKIHGIPALEALSLPARAETHSELDRPLFFPRLQTIEINPYLQPAVEFIESDLDYALEMDFGGQEIHKSEPDPGVAAEVFVCKLLACLTARAQLGAKLKTVKWITNGPVLDPRRFEGLVEELFIDGELIELGNQ